MKLTSASEKSLRGVHLLHVMPLIFRAVQNALLLRADQSIKTSRQLISLQRAFLSAHAAAIDIVRMCSITILFGGPLLVSCSDSRMDWNEQVRLQSGEVIVVSRTAKFKENWIAGGGGGSFNKGMSLQITQPIKADNPDVWNARFVPILLDRDPENYEWFVVATFFHCDSWYELGRPKLPYTEFRFRHSHWIQQPLSEKWIGRTANVLPADLSDKAAIAESMPTLSLERKAGILANDAVSPEFKRIVSNWPAGKNC